MYNICLFNDKFVVFQCLFFNILTEVILTFTYQVVVFLKYSSNTILIINCTLYPFNFLTRSKIIYSLQCYGHYCYIFVYKSEEFHPTASIGISWLCALCTLHAHSSHHFEQIFFPALSSISCTAQNSSRPGSRLLNTVRAKFYQPKNASSPVWR